MVRARIHEDDLVPPIEALESYLRNGGVTILRASFEQAFFADPAKVKHRTPYFPDRARFSRKFYPGKRKGERATWKGREIVLDDNAYAQQAWQRYTGRRIYRGLAVEEWLCRAKAGGDEAVGSVGLDGLWVAVEGIALAACAACGSSGRLLRGGHACAWSLGAGPLREFRR